MRLQKVVLGVVMVLILSFFSNYAIGAGDKDRPAVPEGELEKVGLASKLREYGVKHDDALALLAAARIFRNISSKVKGKKGEEIDVDKLLKRAEILARKDRSEDHLVGIIKEFRTKSRGYVWMGPRSCTVYEWRCNWAGCGYVSVYYPC